jgi:Superinfection immunity protein
MTFKQIMLFPPVYMAPTIAAFFYKKRASSLLDIGLTNLIFGWTYIGWAFAWILLIYSPRGLVSSTVSSQSHAPSSITPQQEPANPCSPCSGSGRQPCQICYGSGGRMESNELARVWAPCQHCNGSGKQACLVCGGTGSG